MRIVRALRVDTCVVGVNTRAPRCFLLYVNVTSHFFYIYIYGFVSPSSSSFLGSVVVVVVVVVAASSSSSEISA